jgi:hypothetical protein
VVTEADHGMIFWQDGPMRSAQMSPQSDSTLDDSKRIIADLRRQLADRTAERDEADAQKVAMAEVLRVINSSPGDLTPVFDAILEKATE